MYDDDDGEENNSIILRMIMIWWIMMMDICICVLIIIKIYYDDFNNYLFLGESLLMALKNIAVSSGKLYLYIIYAPIDLTTAEWDDNYSDIIWFSIYLILYHQYHNHLFVSYQQSHSITHLHSIAPI